MSSHRNTSWQLTAKKCGELAEFLAQAPGHEQREERIATQSELALELTSEAPVLATNASENKTMAQQRARITTLRRRRGRLKLHNWDSPHVLRRRGETGKATSLICDSPSPPIQSELTTMATLRPEQHETTDEATGHHQQG